MKLHKMTLHKYCIHVFAILACLLSHAAIAGDKAPTYVTEKELKRHWVVAEDLMPRTLPPMVRSAFGLVDKYGRITLDYEVTINEKGVPVDFKFKSITPSDIDPKPFIASVMWMRYKPAANNPTRQPVRLHGPLPFFTPKS